MNTINCVVPGCTYGFKTAEPVSPKARFVCKNHPRSVQVKAVEREYDENKDNADQDICFQANQLDPNLRRATKPQGTNHVLNQGSDVLRSVDIVPEYGR